MAGIARLRLRDRDGLGVVGSLGNRQTTRGQHLFDSRNDLVEQPGSPECISAATPHRTYRVGSRRSRSPLCLSRNFEGDGDDRFELENICNVVHERKRFPSMKKADRRRVTCREDGGLRQAIQARGSLREASVRQIRRMEIADLVTTGIPLDAMLSGQQFIQPLDPRSLDPTQLIDRTALRRRFAEPHREHLPDHSEARLVIER